jgi:hypothetical protein
MDDPADDNLQASEKSDQAAGTFRVVRRIEIVEREITTVIVRRTDPSAAPELPPDLPPDKDSGDSV